MNEKLYRIEFSVGRSDQNGDEIPEAKLDAAVNKVALALCEAYGGCTRMNTTGYWIYKNGYMKWEESIVLYSYTNNEPNDEARKKWKHFAAQLAEETNQEAVLIAFYEAPGQMAFCGKEEANV